MQRCRIAHYSARLTRHPHKISSTPRRRLATLSSSPDFYDVVCVGGGPAGLSLVSALRSSKTTAGLKIALIESQDLSKTGSILPSPSEYSNRCSSLTPASVRFLSGIGAWNHIDRSRIQPYDAMHVWDGVTGSQITFDWLSESSPTSATAQEQHTIAYMAENSNITSALLSRVCELGDVTVYDNARVESIELGEEKENIDLRSWPLVALSNGTTLAARLLIGADGANSPVRTFAGIASRGWDYERHGVVATLRTDDASTSDSHTAPDTPPPMPSPHATAYQRFLPTGPIALLPMPTSHVSLVWSTLPSHAAHLKTLSEPDFLAMVNAAFRLSPVDLRFMHTLPSGQSDELSWRLPHTKYDAALVPPNVTALQHGTVASFPLRMRHADTYTGERVALVGDAAHTVHPLAGQGLNLGQADVEALASVIEDAVASGMDIGSTMALEEYNRKRYVGNHVMLGVVDKLHKLYSWEHGPVVAARGWGLSAVDGLGWVKRGLMRVAAGGA